jgi:shikimate kinase
MTRSRHVVLVGLMGAGKTTIGVPLARALGRPYRDNDAELELRTGRTAHDLAATDGMEGLHRAESATLGALLDGAEPDVVSASASAVADADMRARLEPEFVVWLDPDPDTLADRFTDAGYRPDIGADPRAFFEAQYAARAPLYREIADYVLQPAPGADLGAIVAEIVAAVRRAEAGTEEDRQ